MSGISSFFPECFESITLERRSREQIGDLLVSKYDFEGQSRYEPNSEPPVGCRSCSLRPCIFREVQTDLPLHPLLINWLTFWAAFFFLLVGSATTDSSKSISEPFRTLFLL